MAKITLTLIVELSSAICIEVCLEVYCLVSFSIVKYQSTRQYYHVKLPDEVLSKLAITRVSLIIWNQRKLNNDIITDLTLPLLYLISYICYSITVITVKQILKINL